MDHALYFLALILPGKLGEELNHLKRELSVRYKTFSALKSPSHITLLPPFRLGLEQREKAVEILHQLSVGQKPFMIHLKNFQRFGERTLYIEVEPNEALKALQRRVVECMQELVPDPSDRPFVPHVTLLNRDVTPENFQLAWNEFWDKEFEAPFESQSLCLLELTDRNWEVIEEFIFKP